MKNKILFGTLVGTGIILLLLVVANKSSVDAGMSYRGSGLPEEEKKIEKVIENWYEIQTTARAGGGDVSRYPEVLVDTGDYPIDEEQRALIEEVYGKERARTAGFLTMMQVQDMLVGQGSEMLKDAIKKAREENRELTKKDLDELQAKNHGQILGIVDKSTHKTELAFEAIEIANGKTTARVYDGGGLREFILVQIDGQWFISSGKTLRIDV